MMGLRLMNERDDCWFWNVVVGDAGEEVFEGVLSLGWKPGAAVAADIVGDDKLQVPALRERKHNNGRYF
jgi:hypothetical protein